MCSFALSLSFSFRSFLDEEEELEDEELEDEELEDEELEDEELAELDDRGLERSDTWISPSRSSLTDRVADT